MFSSLQNIQYVMYLICYTRSAKLCNNVIHPIFLIQLMRPHCHFYNGLFEQQNYCYDYECYFSYIYDNQRKIGHVCGGSYILGVRIARGSTIRYYHNT